MFLKDRGNSISLIDHVIQHIPFRVFRVKDYMKIRDEKTSGWNRPSAVVISALGLASFSHSTDTVAEPGLIAAFNI